MQVHGWLREELARLREEVEGRLTAGGPRPMRLQAHCLAFCSALTRHHTAEDGGVFPTLAAEHPELAPALAELSRDHEQIAEILERLQAVVDGLSSEDGTPADPAAARQVRGEIDGLIALVESHFTYEEKKLVAALNEVRTPLSDEFTLPGLVDLSDSGRPVGRASPTGAAD
jgi:iron-sulfur cluster repair protein YtfE (RIC family)